MTAYCLKTQYICDVEIQIDLKLNIQIDQDQIVC